MSDHAKIEGQPEPVRAQNQWGPGATKATTEWQPLYTMPKSGSFLVGVWEGSWNEPRKTFRVFEASMSPGWHGPVWGRQYRTAEGEAYELVGWMPKPLPPQD